MNNSNPTKLHKILTIVGWILCVLLVPILIVNCTLIVKSFVNQDEVPDFGGVMPLIVLTDSMYPDIKSGDLIICHTVDPTEIQVGDVISFFDPAGNGTSVVTHKVVEVINAEGRLSFRTKGINNNTEDRLPVSADKVIARYGGFRIPGAGNVAIFMQSTAGLLVCIVLPIGIFIAYEMIRRRKFDKDKQADTKALLAELEALRAQQAAANQAAAPAEAPAEPTPEEPASEDNNAE